MSAFITQVTYFSNLEFSVHFTGCVQRPHILNTIMLVEWYYTVHAFTIMLNFLENSN